eukprot:TRINITY_DN13461_c0_g1_i1.p1 TRINITY_DN13461_c0_g1~~TRINITY_DN13461_c0_g1_i1.p1  ORF type:complete len:1174 (-),score=215.87 TRINITY_DN13461_c0_g1_i1:51-3572(-)
MPRPPRRDTAPGAVNFDFDGMGRSKSYESGDFERVKLSEGADVDDVGVFKSKSLGSPLGNKAAKVLRAQTTETSIEVRMALNLMDSQPGGQAHKRRLTIKYFFGCLVPCILVALVTNLVWSSMLCAATCLQAIRSLPVLMYVFAGIAVSILFLLYLLDFFWPPKLPSTVPEKIRRSNTLSDGVTMRRFSGSRLAQAAVFFTWAALLCSAWQYPFAPLLVTTYLLPFLLALVRVWLHPADFPTFDQLRVMEAEDKGRFVELVNSEAADDTAFYSAASLALTSVGIVILAAWACWAIWAETSQKTLADLGRSGLASEEHEINLILWLSPVIVGVTYLAMATSVFFRKRLGADYTTSNRTSMILSKSRDRLPPKRLHEKLKEIKARHRQDKLAMARTLMLLVSSLMMLLSVVYVAAQMLEVSHTVNMAQACVVAYVVASDLFFCISFQRLMPFLKSYLLDVQFVKSMLDLMQCDAFRAWMASALIPVTPLLLALSATNQAVRKCRGLSDSGRLTRRFQKVVDTVMSWDKVKLTLYTYGWGCMLVMYPACPRMVNFLLMTFRHLFTDLSFTWLLVSIFLIGVVLFLLPPVPGAPIYLFAGVLITQQYVAMDAPGGFVMACVICVTLGLVLKLTACAVQQKLIGERLGSSMYVRSAVGTNKPFVRALEIILARKGLSFGKCIILCGGPDWPVSVLCGILKLSLAQCEFGTLPIIFYITPLSLTGCFYVMQDVNETYEKIGSFLFLMTFVMTAIMWALAAWCIQNEMDKNREYITRPLESLVELDWVDYKTQALSEASHVDWDQMPRWLQVLFACGCVMLTLTGHMMYWAAPECFSDVKVTDDFLELGTPKKPWLGSNGVIKPAGLIGLVLATVSLIGLLAFLRWRAPYIKPKVAEEKARLDALEAEWKQDRSRQAREAAAAALVRTSSLESDSEVGSPRVSDELTWEEAAAAATTQVVVEVPKSQASEAPGDSGPGAQGSAEGSACVEATADADGTATEASTAASTAQDGGVALSSSPRRSKLPGGPGGAVRGSKLSYSETAATRASKVSAAGAGAARGSKLSTSASGQTRSSMAGLRTSSAGANVAPIQPELLGSPAGPPSPALGGDDALDATWQSESSPTSSPTSRAKARASAKSRRRSAAASARQSLPAAASSPAVEGGGSQDVSQSVQGDLGYE